jgi:hypothetical protein
MPDRAPQDEPTDLRDDSDLLGDGGNLPEHRAMPAGASSGNCGAIFAVTGADPGFSASVGTVQITNTGALPSTFALSLGSAVTSGAGSTLCGDLTLAITDSTGASVYNGALTSLATTPNLSSASGSPSTTWNQNDTNTFTFKLALPGSTSTDQDSTCTADFTWPQTQA